MAPADRGSKMKRKMPQIKQVMTPFPHSIEIAAPLTEARAMMQDLDIRHLPVTDEHVLVGIVSERDVAVAFSLENAEGFPETMPVGAICSKHVYSVDLHTDLATVAREMAERHIGSAIVLKDGKLAGIFTTTDCCRFLGDLLQDLYGGGDGEPEAA